MKLAIFFALGTICLVSASPLARRAQVAHCGSSTGGDINVDSASIQARNAPTDDHGRGYPHEFKNYEGLPMASSCQGASKMLELPVFADSHPYNIEHGENPGAARVIFSADDHAVCAIVAHNNHDGNFHLCQ